MIIDCKTKNSVCQEFTGGGCVVYRIQWIYCHKCYSIFAVLFQTFCRFFGPAEVMCLLIRFACKSNELSAYVVVFCRSRSCMCSYSRRRLTESSSGRNFSWREKLGRAWRAWWKTCKPSWPYRLAAVLPEMQTKTQKAKPHSPAKDPKDAHVKKKEHLKLDERLSWKELLLGEKSHFRRGQ